MRALHVVALIAYRRRSVAVVAPVLDRDPELFGIVLPFAGTTEKCATQTATAARFHVAPFWTVFFFSFFFFLSLGQAPPFEFTNSRSPRESAPPMIPRRKEHRESRETDASPSFFFPSFFYTPPYAHLHIHDLSHRRPFFLSFPFSLSPAEELSAEARVRVA